MALTAAAPEQTFIVPAKRKRPPKIRKSDVAESVRSLGIMLEASTDELGAVDTLATQYVDTALGDAFDGIASDLETGSKDLAQAVAAQSIFPPIVGKLLTVGSKSGTSSKSLQRAADIMDAGQDLMQKIRGAVLEPAGMLAAILIFLYYDIIGVLPQFRTMFAQLGRPLPLTSQILEIAGYVLIVAGVLTVIGSISWAAYYNNKGRHDPKVRVAVGRLMLRLPVVGPTLRAQYLSQTFTIIHNLAEVGMGERDSLITAAEASSNWALRNRLEVHAAAMETGAVEFPDVADGEIVPATAGFMLRSGFASGSKTKTLANVADAFRRDAVKRTENLTTALGPIANGVVSIVFVLVMLAIYLPVYDLINATLAF